jgi:radical SAM superfamily enzyme YgiQ (UPF0313 family)
MGKRLLLINPVNSNRAGLTVNHTGLFPPLGLGIVAALTPSDWCIEILDENFERFHFKEADLVGLSSFTAQITRAYEIAGIFREKNVYTVIGGIHASMMPDEALQYVDTVVIGEAESTWQRFIHDFENGQPRPAYREDRAAQTKISRARHDLFHPNYVFDSIQTARGCPMDCNFCSVTTFNGHNYRQRDIEDVLDELESIQKRFVYFVDDNLYGYGTNAAERAVALFNGITGRGIKKQWFSQASVNIADVDEVIGRAARSGCRMVLLGIEAERDSALEDAGKKLNRKFLDHYEDIFRRINSYGIAIFGSFIYGMERDTPESLRQRSKFIRDSDIDAMQITLMTPLPGTRLFQRLQDEGRLLYTNFPDDWARYDMTEVVFKPLLMTPEELFKGFCDAGMMLYNHAALWDKYLRTLSNTGNLATAWWAYYTNLNYHNAAVCLYVQRAWPSFWQLGESVQQFLL